MTSGSGRRSGGERDGAQQERRRDHRIVTGDGRPSGQAHADSVQSGFGFGRSVPERRASTSAAHELPWAGRPPRNGFAVVRRTEFTSARPRGGGCGSAALPPAGAAPRARARPPAAAVRGGHGGAAVRRSAGGAPRASLHLVRPPGSASHPATPFADGLVPRRRGAGRVLAGSRTDPRAAGPPLRWSPRGRPRHSSRPE